MTSENQSISEDYDYDYEPVIFDEAFGDDIDRLNSDVKEGNKLEATLQQLLDSANAVDQHGINPPTFDAINVAGLLTGTAFGSLSMESFQDCKVDSPETEMAMEALGEQIKNKMVEWSDKIVSLAKSMAEKVTGILSGLWSTIKDQVASLGNKVWDKTKATGATIKAHPYRTVALTLAAAGTVAAIIAYSATSGPGVYGNETQLQSFLYKLQDKIAAIKWPFGKPNVEIVQNGTKILYRMESDGTIELISKSPAELGWTQSAVKAIGGQVGRIWTMLKSALGAVSAKIVSAAKFVNDIGDPGQLAKDKVTQKTGSKFAGWISQQVANKAFATALWSVVGVLTKLLTDVVVKSFKTTKDTLNDLKPAVQTA